MALDGHLGAYDAVLEVDPTMLVVLPDADGGDDDDYDAYEDAVAWEAY